MIRKERMVKKLVGALALAAMLVVAACGNDTGQGTVPARVTRVGMAYNVGGRGDGSFNDAAYAGAAKALQETGAGITEAVAGAGDTDADRQALLRGLAATGCNPVIAVGYIYGAALDAVAREFPATTFAIVDAVVAQPNVGSLVFASEQSAYLAGVIAASASKTGRIGFIGAMNISVIEAFEAGYIQGARSVNPTIVIASTYLGAADDGTVWNDPDKARNVTVTMLASGTDVVYAAAGASGVGMLQAVKDAGGPANNLWAIGVDSDQYTMPSLAAYKEVILTSTIKRVDRAVYDVVMGVAAGAPLTGTQRFDLARDGVGYAVSNPAVADYRPAADAAAAEIRSGQITVRTW